jgi:hypothetical protein
LSVSVSEPDVSQRTLKVYGPEAVMPKDGAVRYVVPDGVEGTVTLTVGGAVFTVNVTAELGDEGPLPGVSVAVHESVYVPSARVGRSNIFVALVPARNVVALGNDPAGVAVQSMCPGDASFVVIENCGVLSKIVALLLKPTGANAVMLGAVASIVTLTAAVGDAVAFPWVSDAWQATW